MPGFAHRPTEREPLAYLISIAPIVFLSLMMKTTFLRAALVALEFSANSPTVLSRILYSLQTLCTYSQRPGSNPGNACQFSCFQCVYFLNFIFSPAIPTGILLINSSEWNGCSVVNLHQPNGLSAIVHSLERTVSHWLIKIRRLYVKGHRKPSGALAESNVQEV